MVPTLNDIVLRDCGLVAPIDTGEHLAIVVVMQRRHVAVRGVEGNLVEARLFLQQAVVIQSGLERERDQRALHWIPRDRPPARELAQRGVIAQQCGTGQPHEADLGTGSTSRPGG